MQKVASQPLVLGTFVENIAGNGTSAVRKVGAHLVHASGVRLAREQRERIRSGQFFPRRICLKACVVDSYALAILQKLGFALRANRSPFHDG